MRILTAWDIDPSIPIGCGLLLAAWLVAHRSDLSRGFFFVAGVAVMFVALTSPIDTLGDNYLFSTHMLQHMILILIVPPLDDRYLPIVEALRAGVDVAPVLRDLGAVRAQRGELNVEVVGLVLL